MTKKKIKRVSIKRTIVNQLTEGFDVPKETILNIPIITMQGNTDLQIENFEGILAYGESCIRLSTQCGTLVIEGNKLFAKSMNVESIKIKGYIHSLKFER